MNVLVSSPMRVGSTWVHELLVALLKPSRSDYVTTPQQALAVIDSDSNCVLKSHSITDLDLAALSGRLVTVRVLRNFKDCLISRALYCRNVRTVEGMSNTPQEQEVIDRCAGLETREFVNTFLSEFSDLKQWIGDLVQFERGEYGYTFYYEMLMHNMHDELWNWVVEVGLEKQVTQADVFSALKTCSFQRMRKQKTKGFIGSTGVGQWMHWLEEPLIEKIDNLYFQQRERFLRNPSLRHPMQKLTESQDRVPLFCGGIGDVFLQCCTTDRYRILSQTDGPQAVVNASRNEYANELFDWHPQAANFKVNNAAEPIGVVWSNSDKQALYESLGLSAGSLYEGKNDVDWNTPFFPPEKDGFILQQFREKKFGLFAPFSKKQKTFTKELNEELLPKLNGFLDGRLALLGCGRGYQTINTSTQDLTCYADKGLLIDLSPYDLSVPGSIELARQAEFYVGANSCLALVTMSQGKPTVIIEPDDHTNPGFWPRLFDVEKCLLIQKFSAVDLDAIMAFLEARLPKIETLESQTL